MIQFCYHPPFQKSSLTDRVSFADLLNIRGLLGVTVEIGTHQGDFARSFLEKWRGSLFIGVDPYYSLYSNRDPAALGNRENDRKIAQEKLRGFINQGRCQTTTLPSLEAVKTISDSSLDFVYIDGDHEPPAPKQDIEAWWPKVKIGGYLAGHDIHHPTEPMFPWSRYIKETLESFAIGSGLSVFVVEQDRPIESLSMSGSAWSFYIRREK